MTSGHSHGSQLFAAGEKAKAESPIEPEAIADRFTEAEQDRARVAGHPGCALGDEPQDGRCGREARFVCLTPQGHEIEVSFEPQRATAPFDSRSNIELGCSGVK
jgi:hypothetical protein